MDVTAITRAGQGLKTQLYDLQRVAEQCALMCFTGLTADSNEGIDEAACHFVVEQKKKKVWFLDRGREDYSDLFKHAFVFVSL